ncbi:DUF6881 domain-containing protein [Rhizobium leguminosarum]|uniref:DUF6881 domain-containing protein n=1 Tax=Rhizobium leguminosarum TaxID=384 RepID=UPI00391A30FC
MRIGRRFGKSKSGLARVGYASNVEEVGGTRLAELPVPPLNEINLDPQFQAEAITKADFEKCWIDAIGKEVSAVRFAP